MPTRACPVCSEIIPSDVDYCPYCGNSTRSSLANEDDLIAAQNAERRREEEAVAAASQVQDKQPPAPGELICMMCYAEPATIGDYCPACKQKLELGPEQWDHIRQDERRRALVLWSVIGMVVLVIVIIIIAVVKSHH